MKSVTAAWTPKRMFKSEPDSHIVCRGVVPRSVQVCMTLSQNANRLANRLETQLPAWRTRCQEFQRCESLCCRKTESQAASVLC